MKKSNLFLLAILIAVIIAVISYFLWFLPNKPISNDIYRLGNFKTVNTDFLNQLKELNLCGNWPIVGVSPGTQRSNPFAKQESVISPMAASSTAECLPVKNK